MLKSLHDRSNITFKKILQKYLLEKKAWLAVPICTHSTLMHSSPNTFFALSSKRADRKNHSHSSTLAFPITSQYGDTICKRHLDKFKCDLCHGIQTIFKKLLHGSQAIKSWAKYQDKYLKCIPCV